MKRTGLKIFVFIYILIISIPLILLFLGIKTEPINKNEKKISLNFKRNFPLKSDLFNVFSTIKTDVFDTNPLHQKAIDTKNGWKFLGNDFSNVLSESKAMIVFDEEELEKIKANLLHRKEWLSERNILFYLAVAPNKHTVYGDMIPIKKDDRPTKMQQLDSLCKANNINYIDLGDQFPKENAPRLFHKTDSHWNDIAGYYAFRSSMDLITQHFPNETFNVFSLDDFTIETVNEPIGDLNEMLQLPKNEEWIHLFPKYEPQAVSLDKTLDIPFGYYKDPLFYETRFKSNTNDLKLMVLNDSFFGYYGKYLAENFGNSLFIWNYIFDKDLIAAEQPDILYHEIVERDIDLLIDY